MDDKAETYHMDVTKEIARKIEQQGRWGDDGRGSSQEDVLLELQRDGISGRREIPPAPPDTTEPAAAEQDYPPAAAEQDYPPAAAEPEPAAAAAASKPTTEEPVTAQTTATSA